MKGVKCGMGSFGKKLFSRSHLKREISPVSSATYAVYSSRVLVVRTSRFVLLETLRPLFGHLILVLTLLRHLDYVQP